MLAVDYETKLFLDRMPHCVPAWSPDDVQKAEIFLRERAEMVRAGVRKCPSWFQEELNALDSRMRCWWDEWTSQWVIDRLQDPGYYLTVLQFKPRDDFRLDQKLLDALRECDMQRWSSPAEYAAKKAAEAEKIRAANDSKTTNDALAAVDSLSTKSLETMKDVFGALSTGETITAHGEDAKFLERIEEAKRKEHI